MKNKIQLIVIAALLFALGYSFHGKVEAQALAGNSYGVAPTFTLTNCEANALTAYTNYCSTGAGTIYTCLSTVTTCGTATTGWTCISGCSAGTAGVSSITVCNAAGASCGSPTSGAIQLNIPKTVVLTQPTAATTVTGPIGTLQ